MIMTEIKKIKGIKEIKKHINTVYMRSRVA